MAGSGNPVIFIAGMVAVGGIGYYLYKGGYFDAIIDAINAAIEKIKGGNGNGDECAAGKIKCKDGKCDTQANCNKQCTSGGNWNPTTKKCSQSSNLAMAYNTPMFDSGSFRAYLVK